MVAQLDRDVVRACPARVVPRLLSYGLFEGRPATTKGRWFNPAVQANLTLAERFGPVGRVHRPVFVVGIGRSGTTLLGRLLGVHSQVGFLNEPKAMWNRIVDDEDLIGSYGSEPVRLRLTATDATTEVIDRAEKLFGWYLTVSRSARLVDKYPELVYRVGFVRAMFPDAHIVAILRRPWDVITSIEAWDQEKSTPAAGWWGADDRKWRALWDQALLADPRWASVVDEVDPTESSPVVRGAVEWLLGTAEALLLPERFGPDRLHLVRYDDLVDAPRRFVSELLEACELRVEDSVLGLAERSVSRKRTPTESVAGLPQALSTAIDEVASVAGVS